MDINNVDKRRIRRIFIAVICYLIFFFIIVNVFNLPLNGEANLYTVEAKSTGENVGYISDNNAVIQSVFFHKPVTLHGMDVFASNYGNTVSLPEMQFYVMDNTKQRVYSSSIAASTVKDNDWLHLDLGGIKLKANQRYFICFGGAVENADVVCPTFYMMENDSVSDFLYVNGQRISDRAICAKYSYDVLPMGTNAIVFFVLLFICVIALAAINPDTIRKNIVKIPQVMWLLFWGVFFLSVIFAGNPGNTWQLSSNIVLEAVILLICITLSVVFYRIKAIREKLNIAGQYIYKYRAALGIIFFAVLLSVQFFIVNNIYRKNGFDVVILWDLVTQILDTGKPVSSGYLNLYPNNIGISMVYLLLRSFVKGKDMAMQYHFVVAANVLFVDFGIFMTYKAAKRLLGFPAAVISAFWCALLFGISGWITVPYTDTMTFFIPVTFFYMYLIICDTGSGKNKRLAAAGVTGFLAVWGYSLKPQCVIILIAIAIVYACCLLWKKFALRKQTADKKSRIFSQEDALFLAMFLALGILIGFISYNVLRVKIVSSNYTTAYSMPMTHFFMMGLNENPNALGFGCFSYEDTGLSEQGVTTDDKKKINKEVISERLEDFGISGFLNHLYQKGNWILGDGTFFWFGEGSFLLDDYSEDGSEIQKKVREKYYNTVIEGNKDTLPYINHMKLISAIWFVTLFLIAVAPLIAADKTGAKFWVLSLAILGCFLFTVLFEGRSRYLINYLPLFSIVATAGIMGIIKFFAKMSVQHNGETHESNN